ncbi:hypothetical protein [Palleronia sp.]|uniref:hypothetical protein n=1 Tax=Palleronia sp. TaxID=1940284 RepID=UPI0035C7932E
MYVLDSRRGVGDGDAVALAVLRGDGSDNKHDSDGEGRKAGHGGTSCPEVSDGHSADPIAVT